jgi:hypothetical protein
MKHFFLVVLILVACAAHAQTGVPTPSEPRLMTGPDGALVSSTNPLPTTASIGSITVTAFPVYSDSLGGNATATVDASNRVVISETGGIATTTLAIVNLEAEVASGNVAITAGLVDVVDELKPPATVAQANVVLVANVAQTLTALADRRTVTIKALVDNTESVWLTFDNATLAAAVSSGYQLSPGAAITLPLADSLVVGYIASTAENIFVLEAAE